MLKTATYSPDDNKLRMTASARLAPELYERVRAAGFRWAPRQEIFVCPRWTPGAEDLAIEFCGEVGDEDTTLAERAEVRAERFEEYSDKRMTDAGNARAAAERISGGIPFGQPIMIGHHSQRRAERDADKIRNGMGRAVKMWDTANYWTDRAEGALAHASYKAEPAVRARRIKGLEADLRRAQRDLKQVTDRAHAWALPGMSLALAQKIANVYSLRVAHKDGVSLTASAALQGETLAGGEVWTVEMVQAAAARAYARSAAYENRWIAHYENRLAYERALLGESGYITPPKPATKAVLPMLNYGGEVTIRDRWSRGGNTCTTSEAINLTKAQWAKIPNDYKGTNISGDGTHRVRVAMGMYLDISRDDMNKRHAMYVVCITDSKMHAKPGAGPIETPEQELTAARINRGQDKIAATTAARAHAKANNAALKAAPIATLPVPKPDGGDFEAMRKSLKAGITTVSAPQLFPTPTALAERMIELADIVPGNRVLEPSAGTGNLLAAMPNVRPLGTVTAVEVNYSMAERLREIADETVCGDFLNYATAEPFDRIVMNPPFVNGADIVHIKHALTMLAPGGRLVALCANGPRQRAALEPLADYWEDLPAGSFAAQGTNVNVALLTFERAA